MQIFSKSLTYSDLTSELLLSTEILMHIKIPTGKMYKKLLVHDSTGQPWEFLLCTNCPRGSYSPRPVFDKFKWVEFVEAKGLRAGDKLILTKHQQHHHHHHHHEAAAAALQYSSVVMRSPFTFQSQPIYMDVEQLPRTPMQKPVASDYVSFL